MVFKSACEDLQFQRIPEWDLFKRLNEWRNRMSVTRRAFLRNTTYAGAGLVVSDAVKPVLALAGETVPSLKPYVTGMRMAATPASAYRAYRSKIISNPDTTTWVQLDLGSSIPIDFIQLYPASERMYPGRDQYYAGEGFPLRFKIEIADEQDVTNFRIVADFTQSDFPDPTDNITQYAARAQRARYVRVTATRLRPVKVSPAAAVPGAAPVDGPDYTLTVAKIGVMSGGRDAAVGCKSTADDQYGNKDLLQQLTPSPMHRRGSASNSARKRRRVESLSTAASSRRP
jgi:hypothetical protein